MKTSDKLEKIIRKYEDNPNVILGDKVPSIDELKKLKSEIIALENKINLPSEDKLKALPENMDQCHLDLKRSYDIINAKNVHIGELQNEIEKLKVKLK